MRQTSGMRPEAGSAVTDVAPVQRRTVRVLSGSVALAGLGVTVGITAGGLLARDVAGTDSAAGLGQTAGVLGAAVLAVPLARISAVAGRRAGLAVGYLVSVVGALVTVAAAAASSLLLLVAGLFLFGAATACGLQARYAAADLATPEHRGRALSLVVWATTVGSVLGPNLAAPGARLGTALGLPALAGAFVVSGVVFAVVALVLAALLRPDPLLLARRLGGGAGGAPPRTPTGTALRAVWSSPAGRLGLVAVVVAHAVMVGVMVMTPVHMGHAGGAEDAVLRVVGLVISVHVAGMYLFSPPGGRARRPHRRTRGRGAGRAAPAGRDRRRRDGRPRAVGPARDRVAAAGPGLVLRAHRRLHPRHRRGRRRPAAHRPGRHRPAHGAGGRPGRRRGRAAAGGRWFRAGQRGLGGPGAAAGGGLGHLHPRGRADQVGRAGRHRRPDGRGGEGPGRASVGACACRSSGPGSTSGSGRCAPRA
ncbi:MFS transporter [Blastococcus sp. TML/M2B]|uniref:MFS transporter n=1 Tax=Blastococcus sp. TML/M2B TaxID=2798727 RepID=UPI0028169D0C|nr:MFS transporter [Blastococcus sp. TML/M2B]